MASAHSHALRPLPLRRERRHAPATETARYLGAVSVLLVGAVHAQQYYDAYFSVVPTIGTLFLLSFVGAGAVGVGVALFMPMRRFGPALRRHDDRLPRLLPPCRRAAARPRHQTRMI